MSLEFDIDVKSGYSFLKVARSVVTTPRDADEGGKHG
jgi:hypothetical protein